MSGEAPWGSEADRVESLVKYVVYSFVFDDENNEDTLYSIDGNIPDGMSFDSKKKEIYGTPLKEGRYDFKVVKDYDGKRVATSYTFFVSVNYTELVDGETHQDGFEGFERDWEDWEILSKVNIGLKVMTKDITFISEGSYEYFVKVWLNGKVLTEGVDYTSDSGSTRITLLRETLQTKCNTITREEASKGTYRVEQANTLCVEFNIHPNKSIRGEEYLRRTCNNFYIIKDEEEPTVTPNVVPASYTTTIDVNVADSSGNVMSGYAVELHSKVQTAKSDASGNAQFTSVEMGSHALYVKRSDGTVMAERNFTLVPGDQTSYDGDTITVARGDTIKLTMTVASEQQSSQTNSVTKTTGTTTTSSAKTTATPKPTSTNTSTSIKSNNAKTGDDSNIFLYMILIGISIFAMARACRKVS